MGKLLLRSHYVLPRIIVFLLLMGGLHLFISQPALQTILQYLRYFRPITLISILRYRSPPDILIQIKIEILSLLLKIELFPIKYW